MSRGNLEIMRAAGPAGTAAPSGDASPILRTQRK